jgi:hypothetical protein
VLSLQPRNLRALSRQSKALKPDNHDVVNLKIDKASLQARFVQINLALAEFNRLRQTENSPFKNADLAHTGLATYEPALQMIAGFPEGNIEHKFALLPTEFTHEANLLIRPPFNPEKGWPDRRLSYPDLPLLIVTASGDINRNAIKQQPNQKGVSQLEFSDNQFWLQLNSGVHKLLAGNPLNPDNAGAQMTEEILTEDKTTRMHTSRGGPPSGGSPPSDGGPPSGAGPPPGGASSSGPSGNSTGNEKSGMGNGPNFKTFGSGPSSDDGTRLPVSNVELTAAIRAISIAFFDSNLKHDSNARDWLMNNTNVWLIKSGTFHGQLRHFLLSPEKNM